jgi:hypothetical protein
MEIPLTQWQRLREYVASDDRERFEEVIHQIATQALRDLRAKQATANPPRRVPWIPQEP